MTFNTQHCLNFREQKIDFQIIADTISHCGADIIGLNEMRDTGIHPEFQPQTRILSQLTNIPYWYFAKAIDVDGPNPYGNALLSKYPITSAITIPIPDPIPKDSNIGYESRCILKAELENGLTVLVVHFGLNRDEQQNAIATVLAHIKSDKCILMGDFNIEPNDILLAPLYSRMTDSARLFKQPLFSFPSDLPTVKIDYIFTSHDITISAADIPDIVSSDHRPHIAEIQV